MDSNAGVKTTLSAPSSTTTEAEIHGHEQGPEFMENEEERQLRYRRQAEEVRKQLGRASTSNESDEMSSNEEEKERLLTINDKETKGGHSWTQRRPSVDREHAEAIRNNEPGTALLEPKEEIVIPEQRKPTSTSVNSTQSDVMVRGVYSQAETQRTYGSTKSSRDAEEAGSCLGGGGGRKCAIFLTITCCFLINTTLGFFTYTFSNMTPYVTSYLRNRTGDVNTDYTDTLWVYQLCSATSCILEPLVGLLANRMHIKVYMFTGIVFMASAMFGTHFAIQRSLPLTALTYGFLAGFPSAILYPACIRVSVEWLPKLKGLVTGFNLMGYGVGGFIWTMISTLYINGNNLQPDLHVDKDVYYTQAAVLNRVPGCFLILGIILTSIQFVCTMIICRAPPREPWQISLNINEDKREEEVTSSSIHERQPLTKVVRSDYHSINADESTALLGEWHDYSPKQVLKSRVFWMLWIMMLVTQLGLSFIIPLFKAYGQTFIPDDHFLALVVSVSSLFNALGRPITGLMSDRISPRLVGLMMASTLAVSVATLVSCERTGRVAFLVWMCVIFFSLCGLYTCVPVILLASFGSRHFNVILGMMDMYAFFGSILPTLIAPVVKDAFGWHGIIFLSFIVIFLGILMNLSFSLRCGKPLPPHMLRPLALRR